MLVWKCHESWKHFTFFMVTFIRAACQKPISGNNPTIFSYEHFSIRVWKQDVMNMEGWKCYWFQINTFLIFHAHNVIVSILVLKTVITLKLVRILSEIDFWLPVQTNVIIKQPKRFRIRDTIRPALLINSLLIHILTI